MNIQFNALNFGLSEKIILAIVLGAIAAVLSYRLKFLTKSGSRAAFLLAVPVFGLGGSKWGVPIHGVPKLEPWPGQRRITS
ncbi:MAG: hypothetical protein ACM3P0_08990 [Acidobacteriota bacterium]